MLFLSKGHKILIHRLNSPAMIAVWTKIYHFSLKSMKPSTMFLGLFDIKWIFIKCITKLNFSD